MIKAQDLRIGNLVADEWFDSFRQFILVCDINGIGINLEITDDGNYSELAQHFITPEYEFGKLRGILLTEEILLTVGFNKDNLGAFCMKGFKFIIRPVQYGNPHLFKGIDDMGYSFELSTDESWESIIRVKYLHQLQNLYFALTGEELNTAGL